LRIDGEGNSPERQQPRLYFCSWQLDDVISIIESQDAKDKNTCWVSTTANHSAASFQLGISKTETAAPAEDHVLPLQRATRVRILKGGTGDYAIAWERPSNSPTIPRPFLHWLFGNAHPFPSKSPSVPIQSPSKTRLDGHSGSRDDDPAALVIGGRQPNPQTRSRSRSRTGAHVAVNGLGEARPPSAVSPTDTLPAAGLDLGRAPSNRKLVFRPARAYHASWTLLTAPPPAVASADLGLRLSLGSALVKCAQRRGASHHTLPLVTCHVGSPCL